MNTKIFLTLIAILFISFSGCERVKQVIVPDVPATDTVSTVKIGVIQPSGYYTGFAQGAELARTQINARGGVLGKQIEFIVRDNQGTRFVPDAAESVRIAKTLIEQDGVSAILGPIFSNNSIAVGPVVQQLQRPIIPGSAGDHVTAAGDFVFLVAPTTSAHGAVMAQFAIEPSELSATTAATIRQTESAYTESLTEAFEENFRELGGKIVASEVYQVGDNIFDEQLTNIKAAAPDVLYIAGIIPDIHFVMAQAREIGIQATFLGPGSWDEAQKLFSTLTDNAPLDGVYFTADFSPEVPSAEHFVQAYTALFMTPPDSAAASGYDAMSLLATAIEKTQTLNPAAVRDALSNITNHKGATFIFHYNANRHPIKSVVINTIRDGQIELYKVVEP
ncbi:MAG: ABC transporter substrate-binding protein [Candidatus Poribacteria bacterium]|nr:ABC transporter substrate-binding protein [Candidatus Poribacteria bacterium]